MTRLSKINNEEVVHLTQHDECLYLGEYTSGGGYKASKTNNEISNLKKKNSVPEAQLRWKVKAINYWGLSLAQSLNLQFCSENITFVPIPCSKVVGDPDFDDRVNKVLCAMQVHGPQQDIRSALIQSESRVGQHESNRLTPDEILRTMQLNQKALSRPLRAHVIIVDDVITMGASFAAAKRLISQLENVERITGIFLAKTIWPYASAEAFFEDDTL